MSSNEQRAPQVARNGMRDADPDPLQAIQRAELEAEVLLQEAHRQAEEIVEAARVEAARVRAEAAAAGRSEGEAAYALALEEAHAEAAAIAAEASGRVKALLQTAAARRGTVVDALARKVLGLEGDG